MDCPGETVETTTLYTTSQSEEHELENTGNSTKPTTEPEIVESGDSFTEDDLEKEDFKCKANKSFKVACNTCWCDSNGEGPKFCTRAACNPKTYKPLTQQDIDSDE